MREINGLQIGMATAQARHAVLEKQIKKFVKSGKCRGIPGQTAIILAASTLNRAEDILASAMKDLKGFDKNPSEKDVRDDLKAAGFEFEAVLEAVKTSISEEIALATESMDLAQRRFNDAQSKSQAVAS